MVSEELKSKLQQITQQEIYKVIVSKPSDKAAKYRKIEIEKKSSGYQAAAYTQKQVFHEKIEPDGLLDYLSGRVGSEFLQLNAWDGNSEYMLLISKKGKVTYRCKKQAEGAAKVQESHNRKKKYLLEEGTVIPPLVDMGVFTADGKVVRTMYDKFRQINRFLEIIEDGVRDYPYNHLNIIDFGCGKSYLTLFHEARDRAAFACRVAAFSELGDINGYQTPFPVDMVVTLHACDTATDYALYNAVQWDAKMIFSVPCCQHELNGQIETDQFSLLTRYGIIKERFSALATDAIRANLLEACGYKTQLLEFVDFAHTPKNILIRAVQKKIVPRAVKQNYLTEVEHMMEEFHFTPTLYGLLKDSGKI